MAEDDTGGLLGGRRRLSQYPTASAIHRLQKSEAYQVMVSILKACQQPTALSVGSVGSPLYGPAMEVYPPQVAARQCLGEPVGTILSSQRG